MKQKIKKRNPNTEFLRNAMNLLPIGGSFISSGIESNKISAMRFEGKKFKTYKRIIIDPLPKESLTCSSEICYIIERVEYV